MQQGKLFAASLVLSYLAITVQVEGITVTFQEGVNGYMGTRDLEIRSANPDTNGGMADVVSVDQQDGGPTQALIHFASIFSDDGGPIPAGSTMLDATLSLFIDSVSDAAAVISFNRMLIEWDEDVDTWNTLVGPLQFDDIVTVALPDGVVLEPDIGDAFVEIDVTAGLQAWSDGADNFGWLVNNTTGNGWDFFSSENADETVRPILTVNFLSSGTIIEDLNRDGVVNNADFVILQDNMYAHLDGIAVLPEHGDINFDNKINLADFRQFKAAFPGALGAAQGVPEPGTVVLLAIGLAGVFLASRRSRNHDA